MSTYATINELRSYIGQTGADNPFTDTQLQNSLDYAQEELDNELCTHFADGSVATPDYKQVIDEKQRGLGERNRDYFLEFGPIPNVETALTVAASTNDTTITVSSTNGFPDSGVIRIGTEKITYSAKTANTFTVSALQNNHAINSIVYSYVIEISTTQQGSMPVWLVLTEGDDYDLDNKSARIHVYRQNLLLDYYSYSNPPRTPNRFRVSYLYGHSTIPNDLKKLVLMVASQDLMHQSVRRAHSQGLNNFRPTVIDVDNAVIDKIKNRYYQKVSDTI